MPADGHATEGSSSGSKRSTLEASKLTPAAKKQQKLGREKGVHPTEDEEQMGNVYETLTTLSPGDFLDKEAWETATAAVAFLACGSSVVSKPKGSSITPKHPRSRTEAAPPFNYKAELGYTQRTSKLLKLCRTKEPSIVGAVNIAPTPMQLGMLRPAAVTVDRIR
jgi:hypothetical protein